MAKVNFDSSKHEDSGFPVAPVGFYRVILVSDEKKKNSKNTGSYLNQVFRITKGKQKGIQFFNILNLWNDSEQAVNMANMELASLTRAIYGKDKKVDDTKALFKKEFTIELGIEKDNKGKDRNCVISYGSDGSEPDEPKEKKSKSKDKPKDKGKSKDKGKAKKGKGKKK